MLADIGGRRQHLDSRVGAGRGGNKLLAQTVVSYGAIVAVETEREGLVDDGLSTEENWVGFDVVLPRGQLDKEFIGRHGWGRELRMVSGPVRTKAQLVTYNRNRDITGSNGRAKRTKDRVQRSYSLSVNIYKPSQPFN